MFKLNFVQKDNRGEFHTITGFKEIPELKIIYTKEGVARGGCLHKEDEYLVVFEGTVDIRIGQEYFPVFQGDSVLIPANTPHYILSTEDSVIGEFGSKPENNTKDPEFLKIVQDINKELK